MDQLETERVKCVFGLGGGELHVPHPDFPDEWEPVRAHWYEGPPDYVSESELLEHSEVQALAKKQEFGQSQYDFTFRTAIECRLYGKPAPPKGWVEIGHWTSSGEAACWNCQGEPHDEDSECSLCEGDEIVSLGYGMCEVVYVCTDLD
jgi:hypothetical protein